LDTLGYVKDDFLLTRRRKQIVVLITPIGIVATPICHLKELLRVHETDEFSFVPLDEIHVVEIHDIEWSFVVLFVALWEKIK
jgi:hypothetical protein